MRRYSAGSLYLVSNEARRWSSAKRQQCHHFVATNTERERKRERVKITIDNLDGNGALDYTSALSGTTPIHD